MPPRALRRLTLALPRRFMLALPRRLALALGVGEKATSHVVYPPSLPRRLMPTSPRRLALASLMSAARVLAVLACIALVGAAAGGPALRVPAALADGDPASDVLLGENVFYPYSPPVSPALSRQLDALTGQLAQRGLHLKVALIASPVDLGVIPDLFGFPQKYASFLDQEISFQHAQPLLVVMKAGYGLEGVAPAARTAAARLAPPSGPSSDALAAAALAAVPKLAAASGISIAAPQPGKLSGSGSSAALIVVLAVLAVLAAAALALVTVRARRTPTSE